MRAPILQLADRLIGKFKHLSNSELPACMIRCGLKVSRTRPGEREDWGAFPIILIAADAPALVRVGGGDSIEMRVGDSLLMTGRQFQEIKPGGLGKLVGFEALGSQPCRFFELDAAGGLEGRDQIELFCAPLGGQIPECWVACHELYCLLDSVQRYAGRNVGERDADPALRSMLKLAVIESARALQSFCDAIDREPERSNAARVMGADAYVTCNIERDIRKSELADFLGVSVSQLTLAFREVGQLAVRDRLRFRRIEAARHLLADTSLSIAEVAERVGMNYRHFIRAFRQTARLTPLRYRKYARVADKSDQAWDEFFHTENFDLIAASDDIDAGLREGVGATIRDGAVTALISNGSRSPVSVSRLGKDGAFVNIGIVPAEKRLAFTDVPKSVWKVTQRTESGSESIFITGATNSHFIFRS